MRLVDLNVKVADISGRGVADLKKENFSVFEDGVKQTITYFEPVSAPITLVLMLDFSGSTEQKSILIKQAAGHFIDTLKPNDRIAVVAFTAKFKLVSDFSNDHVHLKKQIGKIKNGQGTALYDAVWRVYDMLSTDKQPGRKAIVLMTDGVDESIESPELFPGEHPYEQLLNRAAEENASIYPIYVDTEEEEVKLRVNAMHKTYETARLRLAQLAEQTGGLAFKAYDPDHLVGQEEDLGIVFNSGAALATIGSLAVKNEAVFVQWLQQYGADRFLLGADVKEEKIAVGGWLETTTIWVYDFIEKYIEKGVQQIFCTDVSKDGLLQGPSVDLYREIMDRFPSLHFIASGGVSSTQDLEVLQKIGCKGVIVGKAIYEGRIKLEDLVKL